MKPHVQKMKSGPGWKCSFDYLASFGATARQAFDNMVAEINNRPEYGSEVRPSFGLQLEDFCGGVKVSPMPDITNLSDEEKHLRVLPPITFDIPVRHIVVNL